MVFLRDGSVIPGYQLVPVWMPRERTPLETWLPCAPARAISRCARTSSTRRFSADRAAAHVAAFRPRALSRRIARGPPGEHGRADAAVRGAAERVDGGGARPVRVLGGWRAAGGLRLHGLA